MTLFSAHNISLMILFAVFVGVVSGVYPALIMSAFSPAEILKGKFKLSGKHHIRKTLFVIQFSLSILLIVLSITLGRQVMYLVKKTSVTTNRKSSGSWSRKSRIPKQRGGL